MTAITSSQDKARPHFDIAVIGAGVNGAGIARDAALRGLKTVVIEQDDVCSGTSAWSSRLIHGGLRYLEYAEIPLVYESLRERRTLRVIAPHLVEPLRINIPVYAGAKRAPCLFHGLNDESGRFEQIRVGQFALHLVPNTSPIAGVEIAFADLQDE